MHSWIEGQFGSLETVEQQKIVRVVNRWTLEEALFNELRSRRPLDNTGGDLEAEIEATTGDPFCNLDTGTPADVFGRIRGRSSATASNVAKYEAWSAVIVFDEHNPLRLTEAGVDDAIRTAWAWAARVHQVDPPARFFLFMWNCLWRSGSSIVHGHAQAAVARRRHYAHVERWRLAAAAYRRRCRTAYFEDLFEAHRALGLAFEDRGVRVLAHLTPLKERETLLIAPSLTPELRRAVYLALSTFTERLGVRSFNAGMYHPPLAAPRAGWKGFPVLFRVLDRGDPGNRNSDIGAMELFAASVIASNPFDVAAALRQRFSE